jgi:hypothetical protein
MQHVYAYNDKAAINWRDKSITSFHTQLTKLDLLYISISKMGSNSRYPTPSYQSPQTSWKHKKPSAGCTSTKVEYTATSGPTYDQAKVPRWE